MSMWTWVNRTAGTGMGCILTLSCLVILAAWHAWQSLHHAVMSADMPRQTTLPQSNLLVACVPGWALPCQPLVSEALSARVPRRTGYARLPRVEAPAAVERTPWLST